MVKAMIPVVPSSREIKLLGPLLGPLMTGNTATVKVSMAVLAVGVAESVTV